MTTARMDLANKAMCYALRFPGPGLPKVPLWKIRQVVRKTDGKKPTEQGIQKAAVTFKKYKKKRGRKLGSNSTTKAEDRD